MTIDEALSTLSIHLHVSKETEHEILAEIRAHLEDAVAQAASRGEDEQLALEKAVADFGMDEVGPEIQEVNARREAIDAVFITGLPVLFAIVLRWLTFAPDGSARNWQQMLVQPGFYILACAAFLVPFLILHRWRYALIGWSIFWFLSVIFIAFPNIQNW